MKQITIQQGVRLAFLGRLDASLVGALQVNGRSGFDGEFGPSAANINDVPQARAETGFLGSARVMTPDGQTAIQDLMPGDVVLDATDGHARVTHILKAPATRHAICIRAPYFGLNQDIVLGADHRIAVTSDTAEYLFGAETVLVPAWVLKDGRKGQHWNMSPRTHLYQIQLDRPAALKFGNCAVESMPKSGQSIGKILSEEEARCFAAEHKSGYQN